MTFGVRAAALAATLVVLPAGLAGCGDDPRPQSAPSTTSTTPTATKPTASAPAAGAGALTTASFLQATKKAVAGKDTVRMSMNMVALGQTMTMNGVAKLDDKNPAMSIEMSGAAFGGGTAKLILVNKKFYVSFPGQTPAGKFVKVDASDSSNAMAKQLRETIDGMDPNNTFKAFDKGLKKVTFVARETVDGEQLDHYKVTVDTKAALAAQGEKMTKDLPKTIVYDIWLDGSKLMRKVVFAMGPVKATMKASDYGKPVTIKAPPAKDIVTR